MIVLDVLFWVCAALIVWTQLGYALALALLARVRALALPAQRRSVFFESQIKTPAPIRLADRRRARRGRR